MKEEQNLSYYINKAAELSNESFEKKIRIALIGSFTLNGLAETLKVKCADKQIQCTTYTGRYNQYNQEILDSQSDLYKFSPDLSFLFIDTRTILGDLFHHPYSISTNERKQFVDRKITEIKNLAEAFCKRSKSKLIITNFNIPSFSPYGIIETKMDYGFHQMINDLNHKLSSSFSNSNSVYIYDFNSFVLKRGEKNIFDYKQFLFGDMKVSLNHIPFLTNELVSYVIGYFGISKKCIVVDLDNTLWGGIIGEDGFNGIKLGPEPPGNAYLELQKILLSLYNRGIILAINSKNNSDDAIKVIKEHPYMLLREEHFACMKINWNDKISNMREIVNEINIGADSLVFIDDDPVNREYMKTRMPQVLTIDLPQDPSHYADTIKDMNEFSVLDITHEDKQRGKLYVEQRKRNELEKSAVDLEGFLKELDLKILIKNANEFTIPRISQLTLKTNQFNLTTKRYQETDIKRFSEDDSYLVGCAQVEDKFGDNGITGVFIVNKENPKEWFLDTFLLSCRVMGREVEKGILGHIIIKAQQNNVEKIKAQFIPTQKNKPIEEFLPKCGFQKENGYWVYRLDSKFQIPPYLTVRAE